MGIPSTVATLSVPLIGIVDTALVGHLPDVAFLGAVAVASVIFDVLYWGLGFLRMGTTSLVAQYHGANQRKECSEVLIQTAVLALGAGILLILFRGEVATLAFQLTGGSEAVQNWANRYFEVRILAAPMVLFTLVLTGFFRGIADAITPMWLTILVNIVNVIADYAFIYGKLGAPELGVVGAAWASVLAVSTGAAYGFCILMWKYRDYVQNIGRQWFNRDRIRLVLSTNFNLFARTACLLFAQFFMLGIVARMNETALGAHAVLWQVWALVSYSVDGFAHSAETLVGNFIGEREFARARRVSRLCLFWGIGLGVIFGLTYFLGMGQIVWIFTDHSQVAHKALELTVWIAAIQPICGMVFILDGILIGANDTRYLAMAMAGSAFVAYLPAVIVFVAYLDLGLKGAWMGYNCLMLARFGTLYSRLRSDRWMQSFVDHGM